MAISREQLYEALVEGGAVTKEEFTQASQSRDAKKSGIDEVLISQGVLNDQQFGQMMAQWYKVPYVNLRVRDVSDEQLELIPQTFARKHLVIPISKKGESYKIAVSDPDDLNLLALLEKYLRGNVEFIYATPRDLEAGMALFQKNPGIAIKNIVEGKGSSGGDQIVRLVSAMIDFAYQNRASDIHIEPEEKYTVIRYRVDGVLQDIYELPKNLHESVITRLKVISRLAIDEHRAAQDGKISHKSTWGDKVEIRLSIVPTTNGEKAVMRLLSEKARQFNLSDLGLSEENELIVKEAIKRPWGMILVTGPTGSGKTTSLYAALKLLNKREVNIATIEDPVEYDIDGINQIQVNTKTNLTFAKGLRSIVRQDPDIIMVGEIRDPETADISVNAAMTGHLVLSSLHTNDAATTFPRLKEMGIEDFLISSTVIVVLAQRLVRKVCVSCIESYRITSKEMKLLAALPNAQKYIKELQGKKSVKSLRLYKGAGCLACNNTGYSGRTGVFEVLAVTDKIREAIMQGYNADQIKDIAMKEGMTTMLHDGVHKLIRGVTTLEEILRVTRE